MEERYDAYVDKYITLQDYIKECYGGLPNESELERQWNELPLNKYDSTIDTQKHVLDVRTSISDFVIEMLDRATVHDESKFQSPEKEIFDRWTPVLKTLTYGSTEYFQNLENIKPATDHHYAVNSHHPQHHENGINGFDLYDLVEMFCDWQAAVKRTKDGDLMKSVEINSGRFEMGEVLTNIFKNTVNRLK